MAYILRPPTVEEKFGRPYALWWCGNRRASSMVKTDGVWETIDFPDILMLEDADAYYLGGHEYELSQAEYDELVAAGYGAYIETV